MEKVKPNKNVKSYRLAVRAIAKEELLTGVVTISVVECEHYKRWHKETKKHQIRIVRTAQDGPEKRKRIAVLDNLVTRYSSYLIRLTRIGDSLALFGGTIGFDHSQDLQVILIAALLNF